MKTFTIAVIITLATFATTLGGCDSGSQGSEGGARAYNSADSSELGSANQGSADLRADELTEPETGETADLVEEPAAEQELIEDEDPESAQGGAMIEDPTEEDPTEGEPDELVELAYEWLTGRFDSSAQAQLRPAYFEIQLLGCPAEAPDFGAKVLYIEQASLSNPTEPYRQRLYVITRSEEEPDTVISSIYTLADPYSAVGACDLDAAPVFAEGEATLKPGCEVYLQWDGEQFLGGTRGSACESRLGDAVYATSQITLSEDVLTSWDRGYTQYNTQAWGATAGAYIFLRQED